MELHFYKYQGTGNDFILLDNRKGNIHLDSGQIARLCDRHMGIGADGLMLLEQKKGYDFHMVYYNSDGNESTMCGNGGRCITRFAERLGIIGTHASFMAIDGAHKAVINDNDTITLHMSNVNGMDTFSDYCLLNTGSPHYVKEVADVANTDVVGEGRTIRHRQDFEPNGINVNFVQAIENGISVRTYERGVENETLSCGTGVTASAIASTGVATGYFDIMVQTPGGILQVTFTKTTATSAEDVTLRGAADFVFEGNIFVS
jgi:diaminopimelate epimerase